MLKQTSLVLTTVGYAQAGYVNRRLAQSEQSSNCWRALDIIASQANLKDQWSTLTSWVDTTWDVRDKNSIAYWYPEDGTSNHIASSGQNRSKVVAMTPSGI
jgi:hypothetical protein